MRTDIILDNLGAGRRIVVDTEFNYVVIRGWYREETLRSGYFYQIYTYLRSQENNGDLLAANASRLLLHPSVGDMVNEIVMIQGHKTQFATVDLSDGKRNTHTASSSSGRLLGSVFNILCFALSPN